MSITFPSPRFSVVIPLFNKGEYIEAALKSALSQGPLLYEIVVVNDGSTDSGPERVAELMRDETRLKLHNQPNAGVSAARNRGIQEALGDYIAFLDADDLYLPGYLEEIAQLTSAYPHAGVFATAFSRFTGASGQAEHDVYKRHVSRKLIAQPFRNWQQGNFFYTCSVSIPRHIFLETGVQFPIGERLGEDQDVWFKLAERFPIAYSDRQMVLYRVDVANSLTATGVVKEILPCYARLANRSESNQFPEQHKNSARRLVASHYINVARACIDSGDLRNAWQLLCQRRSWQNAPYWLRTLSKYALRRLNFVRGEQT